MDIKPLLSVIIKPIQHGIYKWSASCAAAVYHFSFVVDTLFNVISTAYSAGIDTQEHNKESISDIAFDYIALFRVIKIE